MTDLAHMTDDQLVAHLDSLNREDDQDRARLDDPEAITRAARWYAQQGIAIFPLRVGGKTPLIGKAHPDDLELQRTCKRACGRDGHGLYDATTDPARVAAWWQRTPQANIGIRTGLGFDVVDVDGPAGIREWADMVRHARCDKRPDGTPSCCDEPGVHCPGDGVTEQAMLGTVYGIVRTAGDNGGLHYYIAPTGQANGAKMLDGHVDYRGDGGYVVAPPSRVRGRYVWTQQIDIAAIRQDVA